jgi:hypothetical protein
MPTRRQSAARSGDQPPPLLPPPPPPWETPVVPDEVPPPDDVDPPLDDVAPPPEDVDPPVDGADPPPLDVDPPPVGTEETEPELADEPLPVELVTADVLLDAVFGLAFGLGGACSAGRAPGLARGVMLACCALAELDWASDSVMVGADVFLTADPMANAAASPATSANASSSQRLRTS